MVGKAEETLQVKRNRASSDFVALAGTTRGSRERQETRRVGALV